MRASPFALLTACSFAIAALSCGSSNPGASPDGGNPSNEDGGGNPNDGGNPTGEGGDAGSTGGDGGGDAGGHPVRHCTGFAATPAAWALPGDFNRTAFDGSGDIHSTFDLDGDGHVDLVVTADPSSGGAFDSAGAYSWQMHKGGAAGFATTPATWSIPGNFNRTAFDGSGDIHSTFDLDGDGHVDLVVTADPGSGGAFGAAGAYSWQMYKGGAAGFAASPAAWSIPGDFNRTAFDGSGDIHTTFDLDGDGHVDLVVTADPTSGGAFGSAGAYSWQVYKGGGSGFAATPTTWSIPGNFNRTAFDGSGDIHSTFDLDGDGHVDLVVTADPTSGGAFGSAGAYSWQVYKGGAAGFAATPATWSIPGDFNRTAFEGSGDIHSTFDLDGDGHVDLVVTADPTSGGAFGSVGAYSWQMYKGGASGFATTPTTWSVPGNFNRTAFAGSGDIHSTFDLDDDGCVDFVDTMDPSSGQAFAGPSWELFRGQ